MEMKTNEASKQSPALKPFEKLIGEWETEGFHPYFPDTAFHGHVSFEWIEGGAFLVMRTSIKELGIPSGISIFGSDDSTGEFFMLYFDERGVSRKYDVTYKENVVEWSRETPEFSQRFTLTLSSNGQTMEGKGTMQKETQGWEQDLQLSYTWVS